MILFSLLGIEYDPDALHIAYMEEGKEYLTVDFYSPTLKDWYPSVMYACEFRSFEGLMLRLKQYHPRHEIFHMDEWI